MQFKQRKQSAARVLLALFLTFASALPLAAADNVPAIKTANTPLEQTFTNFAGAAANATIGWSFTVGSGSITVSSLGLYDSGGNGLANAHDIAIWTSGGTLVTSTTIPSGTGATLISGYRYVAITPVTLSAGTTYVIGALYPTQSGDNIIFNSTQTFAAPITFGKSRQTALDFPGTSPLAFPNVNAGLAQGIFGPNFLCSFTELNIDNVTMNEGNASTTSFQFTVSLTQAADAGGVTFDLATADGTAQDDDPATEDNDYVALALTGQSIAAGNSIKMISVTVNGDLTVEPDETFFVNVTNVIGAYLNDGQGLGTITNEDVAPNTAPVNTVPGAQTTNENTALVFSSGNGNAISISDADAGTAQVRVTLAATNGTLTLAGTIGLAFSTGDGTADATMTFTGTISNINAALNGLSYTPTLGFDGPATLQIVTNDLGNTGSGGPLSDNDTVNITVAPPVKPFVFLANKVTLKSTKQSMPAGDIHSNGLLIVEKGKPSTYNSNLTAVGKITINKQNTINGDVKSQTSVSNSGTINGTKTIGPVANEPLPSLSYSAGGLNKTVPNGGSLTLAPDSYGIVTMSNGGTLKLTSGEYFMNELRYASTIDNGTIEIDLSSGNPITINVVTNLQLGHEIEIRLLPNGEADSKLVTFNTKQSTAANWGREAYLLGSFNAPNAVVTLVKNTQLRGSICAKEILVSNDCLFLHHDSPGSLPGPGNLPKSSFDEDEQPATNNEQPVISYQLEQNYPNPFNPTTTISFALPEAGEVSLAIYNTNGQLVKRLIAGEMNAGQHNLTWDATSERGERVASGVYLYVIKAGEFTAQRKLVLMK